MEEQNILDDDIVIQDHKPILFLTSNNKRFVNYLIDIILYYIIIILFFSIVGFEKILDPDHKIVYSILPYIILFFYNFIFEAALGKTPAKFITKCKVITNEGKKPTIKNILIRSLCRFIPFDPFSYLGKQGKGWHDSIPKCYVVSDDFETKL